MSIRFALKEDFLKIKSLWDICFPEDPLFNEWFFNNKYKDENTLVYCLDGEVCSMLQIFPYQLKVADKVEHVHYIYGVATHPDYRKQGLMESLLNRAYEIGIVKGHLASILIPQEKWLFEIYEKYDYESSFYVKEISVTINNKLKSQAQLLEVTKEDIDIISDLYIKNTKKNKGVIVRNKSFWEEQIDLFNNTGGHVYCLKEENQCLAYGFVNYTEGTHLCIQEGLGITDDYLQLIAQQIMQKENKKSATILTSFDCNRKRTPIGCIKFINKSSDIQFEGYLNLMFN